MKIDLLYHSSQYCINVDPFGKHRHKGLSYWVYSSDFSENVKYVLNISVSYHPVIGHKEKCAKNRLFSLYTVSFTLIIWYLHSLDLARSDPHWTLLQLNKLKYFDILKNIVSIVIRCHQVVHQKVVIVSVLIQVQLELRVERFFGDQGWTTVVFTVADLVVVTDYYNVELKHI